MVQVIGVSDVFEFHGMLSIIINQEKHALVVLVVVLEAQDSLVVEFAIVHLVLALETSISVKSGVDDGIYANNSHDLVLLVG